MLWLWIYTNDLLPFVWIGLLVIALVIVALGIIVGMELKNKMTIPLPKTNQIVTNVTNTIDETQDNVDLLKLIVSFFGRLGIMK